MKEDTIEKWVDTRKPAKDGGRKALPRVFPEAKDLKTNIDPVKAWLCSKVTNVLTRNKYITGLRTALAMFHKGDASLEEFMEALVDDGLMIEVFNLEIMTTGLPWADNGGVGGVLGGVHVPRRNHGINDLYGDGRQG